MQYDNILENKKEIAMATFKYIDIWYNKGRIHSNLEYRTPME